MAKQRSFACIILLCLSLFLTGCWDRRELQDRSFVLAVGIDTADAGNKPGVKPEQELEVKRTETFVQPHDSKRYRLSLQLLKQETNGNKKQETKTYVISNTGDSLFEMVRDMLGQNSKSLWFEHVQVIIISEAVLKQAGLSEVLDFFKRDSEMRSRIKIYVTPGDARSLLEYSPPSKEAGGIYLADLVRLHTRNNHVIGMRTDLGFTNQYLDNQSNILLPQIQMVDKVVKLGDTAVFKRDKFVGYADEYAVAGLKIMFGTEKSALITAECPNHPGHQVVFELFRHDTILTPHVEDGTIYFTLDITMYGNIGELQGDLELDNTMDPQYIHKLEDVFAEEIKRNVLYAEKIFKKEMRVDSVSKFAYKLKAHEPDTWEKVKDQWDELYPEIPLVISVNIFIKNIGAHR